MNHYENVKALAANDDKAELKVEKIKQDKSVEPACPAHCSFDEMGKASFQTTGDGTANTKNEEMEQNEKNYYYTRRRCCRKYLKYAVITVAVIAVVVFIILIAMPFKKNNIKPCEPHNGGCEPPFLPAEKDDNKPSCCNFFVYVQDNYVRINSIDRETNQLVSSVPYNVESIVIKGEIDFDYDLKNDDFYWADDRHIYRMKLRKFNGDSKIILSLNEPNTTLLNIAYDWYTGNMYFVKRRSDSHQLMLFNVNLGEEHQKTLMTYYYNEGTSLHACPYALRLHPAEHSMFYVCWRFIQRATINNTYIDKIHSSFPEFEQEYRLVAVDYTENRVYWIGDSGLATVVKHANLDSSDLRVIIVGSVRNGRTIDVYERWLYVGNSTGIWRVDKETGRGAVQIVDGSNSGFKVVSEKVHFRDDGNKCAEGNGGCEQMCLSGEDGPVCMCEDYMATRGFTCSRD